MPETNEYLVSGTRYIKGAIGEPESFQTEITAASSRDAYLQVNQDERYTHIRVVAIKMKCLECGQCHVTVPPTLYLYGGN